MAICLHGIMLNKKFKSDWSFNLKFLNSRTDEIQIKTDLFSSPVLVCLRFSWIYFMNEKRLESTIHWFS